MTADPDRIPEIALDWARDGRGGRDRHRRRDLGLSPRARAGRSSRSAAAGEMMGSVSGGCVEGAVVAEALDALADGRRGSSLRRQRRRCLRRRPRLRRPIRVLVEPVAGEGPPATSSPASSRRGLRGTPPSTPSAPATGSAGCSGPGTRSGPKPRPCSSRPSASPATGSSVSTTRRCAWRSSAPSTSPRPSCRWPGSPATTYRHRSARGLRQPGRFPGARLVHDWPDEALAGLGLDSRSAVVTLTHDPKLDDPAIRAAFGSPAVYFGCLGSTRTHAKRVARLTGRVSTRGIARIHAPIGADIGAQSPAEIAVAILAQMTERLRRPCEAGRARCLARQSGPHP